MNFFLVPALRAEPGIRRSALSGIRQPGKDDGLSRVAAAYQNLGMYHELFSTLDEALNLALERQDAIREALLLGQFSDAWLALGRTAHAARLARDAMEPAQGNAAVLARVLNNYANVLSVQKKYDKALEIYGQAFRQAAHTQDRLLQARIELNELKALWHQQKGYLLNIQRRPGRFSTTTKLNGTTQRNLPGLYLDARSRLAQRFQTYKNLPNGQAKAQILLATGALAREMALNDTAMRAYRAALSAGGNSRMLSLAHGRLAADYSNRLDDALRHSRQALAFAIKENPHSDLLFRWLWQQGRIVQRQNRRAQAIRLYQQALEAVQPAMLSIGYRKPVRAFEQWIRPLYYELADLLLQQADQAGEKERRALLKQVRDAVERMNVVEIQDYYRDECILAGSKKPLPLPPRTAILYPLPLDDRLELLLDTGDKIHRVVVPIARTVLRDDLVEPFRKALQTRTHSAFLSLGQQLYGYLVKPLEQVLKRHATDTLVLAPDALLRRISLAALHDGEKFLMERYALAAVPELSVVHAGKTGRREGKLLLAGTRYTEGYAPLPSVPAELTGIQALARETGRKTDLLLNDKFLVASLEALLKERDYRVVHLAGHSEFNADPQYTYLRAHDREIHMDELQSFIGTGHFRGRQSLELLTLSACKTAVGDDRATLGLAGIAFKAGARSALASLWHVDDEATAKLMSAFYQAMLKHGLPKAKALQQAQQKLLANPRFRHPAYWAPFLLIGDWS
ncbi:MAG: CHAT domain-containing protein [Gammaproteobacteria bacterium]|nr:CHAT domain-containing protein [Gammaproteobacteria bacterium]